LGNVNTSIGNLLERVIQYQKFLFNFKRHIFI